MGPKRKRAPSIKLKPESQQIFKGLSFFFLPNDDVDPARRLRITRARESGATWVREWRPENITHIIADNRLTYQDVIKFLKIPSIPEGTLLVTEKYPTECLTFGSLYDPDRSRFQIPGSPNLLDAERPLTASSQATEASLQLKRPSRPLGRATAVPPTTPSHSEPSSEEEMDPRRIPPRQWPPITYPTQHQWTGKGALEDAIKEAKTFENLPADLSEESDDQSTLAGDFEEDLDDDDPRIESTPTNSPAKKKLRGQDTFSCMQPHSATTPSANPNQRTIEVLQEMADYNSKINDPWRPQAYRKAINALRRQSSLISTADEAIRIPGIGQRISLKIEEIVRTNSLRRLEHAKTEPLDQTLKLFMGIYGVGYAQAQKWIARGFRTLEDILTHAELTDNQRVGVIHYHDFAERIPRAEVESLAMVITAVVKTLDIRMQVHVMGSYRRGAITSGDVDLIITKPGVSMDHLSGFLHKRLVPMLFSQEILKVGLITGESKWQGAGVLPRPNISYSATVPPPTPVSTFGVSSMEGGLGESSTKGKQPEKEKDKGEIWRRIDILLVPPYELGAALLYFTGNDLFNRSIRLLARKKGWKLNRHGLFSRPSTYRPPRPSASTRTSSTSIDEAAGGGRKRDLATAETEAGGKRTTRSMAAKTTPGMGTGGSFGPGKRLVIEPANSMKGEIIVKDIRSGNEREGQPHQKGWKLLEAKDEKRIFEILGVPYREPGERNV
ncbi:MAG: phosphoglycerate kinase [Watsoniomyces obsoletus]|nr:MAG: phosphoglycerate kinase [Watsoniomyces obsoletus]